MNRYAHKSIFLLLLTVIFVQHSKGQKIRIDTVYYDNTGELVTNQSDYLTYEVRQLDRKKRVNGKTERYTKSGRLTEVTRYVKGEKKGSYYRYNQAGNVMMYGDYTKGIKTGFWVTLDNSGSILTMEEYDNGNMIGMRERPYTMSIDGESFELDSDAEFDGGPSGWGQHLRKHLNYPKEAKRYGYDGVVDIRFVVLSDGRGVATKVVSSPHEILSIESLRVLKLSPPWIPAIYNGKPVDSQMTIRVVFRLK